MNKTDKKAIALSKRLRGKIAIKPKMKIKSFDDFAVLYTPGVAAVSMEIAKDPRKAQELTYKWNTVAIVTDGTRVLGLGNIGPDAAMPVMEGKALLFKHLGGVDAIPITLGTTDSAKIVETVKAIAPSFGGINLEDIESPKSFAILEQLQKELNIPVWHDDNQGTAAVALAGFTNALKLVNKQISKVKVTIFGAGTASVSILRLLALNGLDKSSAVVIDSKGVLHKNRSDREQLKATNPQKYDIIESTNKYNVTTIEEALDGADAIIAASSSSPGTIKGEWIKRMNSDPIVFALANPQPEISYEEAQKAGVKIFATGRSDIPNQINNSLVFPGIFRGVLDVQAKRITDNMAIAAAMELSKYAQEKGLSTNYIIPRMDERDAFYRVAAGVGVQAFKDGVTEVSKSYDELYEQAKSMVEKGRYLHK
jgi:malate dehydrogenase (oxaloacetate-decarboxylating)/malate dehydrogenase (oxaloacetate-decarboxylating)(NADP+)